MTSQSKPAESIEADMIESMLQRQTQVISDLDELFDKIEAVIEDINEQRKREAAEEDERILPFGPQPRNSDSKVPIERAA